MPPTQLTTETVDDSIVSVFVVHFDITRGNVIEWAHPAGAVDLVGAEFKAMPAGSHHSEHDMSFFKHGDLFAVACFHRLVTDAVPEERGSRMRAVGVMMKSFLTLRLHMSALRAAAEALNRRPGDYATVQALHASYCTPSRNPVLLEVPGFSAFVKYCGDSIFVLWKALLLKMRVLLYSPPPVGQACERVACACMLLNVAATERRESEHNLAAKCLCSPNPLFYVSLNDLDSLAQLKTYVACTTERVVQLKTSVYDVFFKSAERDSSASFNIGSGAGLVQAVADVRGGHTVFVRAQHAQLLRKTATDSSRYIDMLHHFAGGGESAADMSLQNFFISLNHKLFEGLRKAQVRQRVIGSADMKELGLDPDDGSFLAALIRAYGLKVSVWGHNSCDCAGCFGLGGGGAGGDVAMDDLREGLD